MRLDMNICGWTGIQCDGTLVELSKYMHTTAFIYATHINFTTLHFICWRLINKNMKTHIAH